METTQEVKDTKRTDMLLVDPSNIVIEEGFNVRQDYGDMEGLMLSIIENGQLEPIIATKVRGEDKYILTEGHRRILAIRMAIEKGKDIPYVKVLPSTGNIEDRLFAMVITGTDKKPLTVLEEGEAYKRLVAFSYTPKEISKKVGKSIAHVYNLLKLADAPKQVKNAIINNEISGNTVVNIIRSVKDANELVDVITNAVAEAKKSDKPKKATLKHTGVERFKTPVQKLKEALEQSEGKDLQHAEMLEKLITVLSDKESSVKQVMNIFK